MYVCVYICLYVRMYACVYVCMCVCMYVGMYVYMYVRMYVCMHVEGRLISNAHSEISRKRDHVFKQRKVGSKVQYFSYKLTYFFFRHSRLVLQYIFPNLKQVYACRQ